MTQWSVWDALYEWQGRRLDLARVFAYAGVAPEQVNETNQIIEELSHVPSQLAFLSSEGGTQDDIKRARYLSAFYRYYHDLFSRIEQLSYQPWVPEMFPLSEEIRAQLGTLRAVLGQHPGEAPDVSVLQTMLRQRVELNHPQWSVDETVLEERRNQLIQIAGYPLLVQRAARHNLENPPPPLASLEFQKQLDLYLERYLQTPWMHCKTVSHWFAVLAQDAILARKKNMLSDTVAMYSFLKYRWPSPSLFFPREAYLDQFWYAALAIAAVLLLLDRSWWLGGALLVWLHLSIQAHRREKRILDIKRDQLVKRLQLMKKVRDRFFIGQTTPERLAFQMKQLDQSKADYKDPFYQLLKLC